MKELAAAQKKRGRKKIYDNKHYLLYNKELHSKEFEPFTSEEDWYIVNYFGKIPHEELALSLDRTVKTIFSRVNKLKYRGIFNPNMYEYEENRITEDYLSKVTELYFNGYSVKDSLSLAKDLVLSI